MNHPRYCPTCSKRGKVIASRVSGGLIVRRLICGDGHRFSTVETTPKLSASGRALTARLRQG